jgi:vancomycin permeability regulator SanA
MSFNDYSIGKKGASVGLVISLLLLNLLFLYYVKYRNQYLQLSDFRLLNIGNLLNFLFTILLVIGLLLYLFQKKNFIKPSLLIILSLVSTLMLFVAVLTTVINFNLPDHYIADQPVSKVLTGFLFFSYQFITFIFISILWLSLLGRKELLALRAVTDSIILAVVFLFLAFYYLTVQMSKNQKIIMKKNVSNVAVVLGAAVWSGNKPSPSLASRADKAVELIKNEFAGKILFTGGNAPGELSEAEVAFNYILKKDVDSSKIIIEKNTTSTSEQILFIKTKLSPDRNITNVLIISDSYHLPRIKEICKFFNVRAIVVPSDLRLSFENNLYYKLRESIALLVFWFFAL